MSAIDLDDFKAAADRLAAEAEAGRRVAEATKKGVIAPAFNRYEAAPGEDGRLREFARDAINEVWSYRKRPASHDEIYRLMLELITLDIELGRWPAMWNSHPKQRTTERRTNEIADGSKPQFWLGLEVPPVICVKPGFYQPNPYLFDDSVRTDIAKASKIKLVGESGLSSGIAPRSGSPNPPFSPRGSESQ